ncbi:uncharacterized protein LOC126771385 [Nymphalis io]|uniref:uncharacterized protein LOC126771385 n=1 Tax=Inachis io TaxID=171585 RepID=UPI002167676E|nr:uncharacterized protein LOC126771385 [Nymphalis io]
MKKSKNRSEASIRTVKSEIQCKEEIYVPPLDILTISILDLRVPDEDPKPYTLKITYFDQLLLSSVVTSTNRREEEVDSTRILAEGYMNYDPSDYEKMCLFVNQPLTSMNLYLSFNLIKLLTQVMMLPIKSISNVDTVSSMGQSHSTTTTVNNTQQTNKSSVFFKQESFIDSYCCNIDILPIFIDTKEMVIEKSMESIVPPSVLLAKSWDNFPKITLKLNIIRNEENKIHHKKFRNSNYFKFTLVGCYNFLVPFKDTVVYTAATKLPVWNDMHSSVFTFYNGYETPKRFDYMSFYPHWESLRLQEERFTKGDVKLQCNLKEFQNVHNIDLEYYLNSLPQKFTTVWASFHRTLLLKDSEQWLSNYIRQYKWPLEVQLYEEGQGYSLMGFIDLFRLLYPGEKTTRIVVPLQWFDAESLMEKCGCEPLLATNERVQSPNHHKIVSNTTETTVVSNEILPTGNDGNCAFAIIEVTMARPFMKPIIPPHITQSEINEMATDIELLPIKRECSGRGQLKHDWQATVISAAKSLRRVPYYGTADLCTIIRQLSTSRTRVELFTSFWQEAAIYVNNNFVVSNFVRSNDTYEEMLMIAHSCLMKITYETLNEIDGTQEINATLRAARQSRQLQDLPHAMELYLQLAVERPREADNWRELATCLRDIDEDWANVCINKSLLLNPRHPLSLLSKGSMVFEEDPDAAEPFFVALIAYYPFYPTLWIAANAYYLHRELFDMAQQIMEQIKRTRAEGLSEELRYSRAWERELGDWWDNTPLLPGTSLYYDAADLLLRIRAISLAEVCIARALSETGESPVYYHMVALCCRLRGQIEDALCHLKQGIEKFGEISYLRSLEGECHHKMKDIVSSVASFKKAGSYGSPYIALLSLPRYDHQRTRSILSDVVRRHPSAYAWIALAEDWLMRSSLGEGGDAEIKRDQRTATSNAANCAARALNCDRRAGRAWALLASLLSPSTRRQYCRTMAALATVSPHPLPKSPNLWEQIVDVISPSAPCSLAAHWSYQIVVLSYSLCYFLLLNHDLTEGDLSISLFTCDYKKPIDELKKALGEQKSFCFRIGKVLQECRCEMCNNLVI